MKKFLSAAAIILTMPVIMTGCGENNENQPDGTDHYEEYDYNNNADDRVDHNDRDDMSADEFAHDAIDGAENAVDDVVDGVGDAANDIVDGLDGERETSDISGNIEDSTETTVTDTIVGR